VYLISPLIITLSGWKPVFYLASAVAVLAALVWLIAVKRLLKGISFVPDKSEQENEETNVSASRMIWKMLPLVLIVIAVLIAVVVLVTRAVIVKCKKKKALKNVD
jgi:MFS family permease